MITTCLWFDDQAEEAANFYVRVLRDGSLGDVVRYDETASEVAGRPAGSIMTLEFTVEGMRFVALNGGPMFTFNESVSFMVERDTQDEIDELWDALLEGGGTESQCGWLKDRFGVSWQVVPSNLRELMEAGGDAEGQRRASEALFGMVKLDIETLRRAAFGETVSSS